MPITKKKNQLYPLVSRYGEIQSGSSMFLLPFDIVPSETAQIKITAIQELQMFLQNVVKIGK